MKNLVRRAFLARGVCLSKGTAAAELRSTVDLMKPRLPKSIELVRIGGENDGGYLVPNDLTGVEFCLSPGVDKTASFETDLKRYGIESHLIDFSVDGPPSGFEAASFTKKYLGAVSHGDVLTLSDWISQLSLERAGDLMLQMDIEGAEYEVMLETPLEVLQKFRVVVLEIHSLLSLANEDFHRIFSAFAKKISSTHQVVHIHPNNVSPPVSISGVMVHPAIELTLLRRDRFDEAEVLKELNFPHNLDRRNIMNKPHYVLSSDWY